MVNTEALLRAANWLEANPDKHLRRILAADADGREVPPLSPSAECFCAIGRIAVECSAGDDLITSHEAGTRAGLNADQIRSIWRANDSTLGNLRKWGGNPHVITVLREIAGERPMKPIPISAAEHIAKEYGYDQVVILGRRIGESDHLTTYGLTKQHCDIAGRIGATFKRWMGWVDEDGNGQENKP